MPVFYRKDMMPMSQFSELLKEYIKKKDITIKALAEKCGIDRTYLHKILKGERKVPSVDFVENISLQLMLSTSLCFPQRIKAGSWSFITFLRWGKMSTIAVSRCQR